MRDDRAVPYRMTWGQWARKLAVRTMLTLLAVAVLVWLVGVVLLVCGLKLPGE
jgi:hypothetical protein